VGGPAPSRRRGRPLVRATGSCSRPARRCTARAVGARRHGRSSSTGATSAPPGPRRQPRGGRSSTSSVSPSRQGTRIGGKCPGLRRPCRSRTSWIDDGRDYRVAKRGGQARSTIWSSRAAGSARAPRAEARPAVCAAVRSWTMTAGGALGGRGPFASPTISAARPRDSATMSCQVPRRPRWRPPAGSGGAHLQGRRARPAGRGAGRRWRGEARCAAREGRAARLSMHTAARERRASPATAIVALVETAGPAGMRANVAQPTTTHNGAGG